ncbi:hypothetical protein SAMN00808754_1490 [Thermanaeromonas toyohensis ToBE]|uniref:Uncharacterized protein n=1 Tax=Thermanaeromonas toyohensis ToBE TaxID=698762 RepID=A0A1W1VTL3_9FIRM|nr:hypothetical protein SAMN00808754_1490 [Thermanaeromonas toyohensis ToBE]
MKIRICCKCGEDYSVTFEAILKTKSPFCLNCEAPVPANVLQPLKQLANAVLSLKQLSIQEKHCGASPSDFSQEGSAATITGFHPRPLPFWTMVRFLGCRSVACSSRPFCPHRNITMTQLLL